jgi:small-conductance mechanosensitive channel
MVVLVLTLGWLHAPAGEPSATAPTDVPPSQPKLTERDYLLEELKLVEQQIAQEEKLTESGRSSADKLLSAKRSLLSLKRQLAAYDERTARSNSIWSNASAGAEIPLPSANW